MTKTVYIFQLIGKNCLLLLKKATLFKTATIRKQTNKTQKNMRSVANVS